jgi:hypothetical protein
MVKDYKDECYNVVIIMLLRSFVNTQLIINLEKNKDVISSIPLLEPKVNPVDFKIFELVGIRRGVWCLGWI